MLCDHSLTHTAPRKPPRGTYLQGAGPKGRGETPKQGAGTGGGKALLLGKGDLHGVVLRDLEALQGVAGRPCLHLIVKLHKGNVMPPRDQPDLLEAREPERRGQTSGIQRWHFPLTFWRLMGRGQDVAKYPTMQRMAPTTKLPRPKGT